MKILKAHDIMRRDVAYIGPDVPAGELAEFFNEEGVHGAPVVDAAGHLVGMVSRSDLVRAVAEERPEAPRPLSILSTDEGKNADLPEPSLADFAGGSSLTVRQIMTPEIVTAGEDATAGELAALMREHDIRRVAIVDERKMKGIVSVTDLLPVLVRYEKALGGPDSGGEQGEGRGAKQKTDVRNHKEPKKGR